MRCMRHFVPNHSRKSGVNRLVCSGLASLMLAGGLALEPAASGQVVITEAPPAPIVETIPPSPGPLWVWDPVTMPGEMGSTCGSVATMLKGGIRMMFGSLVTTTSMAMAGFTFRATGVD